MLWLKTVGFIVGEVIYFTLISFLWKSMGWKLVFAHAYYFALISFVVAYIVNPFICAYFANYVTYNRQKIFTVNVFIIFFSIALICSHFNATIFLFASGFEQYFSSSSSVVRFGNETLAWYSLFHIIELYITGMVFTISYNIVAKRQHKNAT